ncbi:MAG: hypothetical protein FWD32_02685, partial [Firmicutes bacterium]|nr:hypothetical protein [Bacillota bacterium]
MGGLFRSALNAILRPIESIFNTLLGFLIENVLMPAIMLLLDVLLKILGQLLMGFILSFASVIDFVQDMFRKLAGLDTYSYQGETLSGDIVTTLLQNSVVTNMFYVLMAVAVLLIIILSIVVIIRNSYNGDQTTTSYQVIGRGLKACALFFFIPVVCLLGLQLAGGVLRAFDQATGGGDSKISNQVIVAAFMPANIAGQGGTRTNSGGIALAWPPVQTSTPFANIQARHRATGTTFNLSNNAQTVAGQVLNNTAEKVDFVFRTNSQFTSGVTVSITTQNIALDSSVLSQFYNLDQVNIFILLMGIIVCLFTMLSFTMGLIKRVYELVILFMVSPIPLAMAPIDDLANFKSSFMKPFYEKAIGVFSAVIAMNLFFSVLPIISTIKL